ncbi:MAG: adenylate/guanylate cyclase domain-containing protein [Gammaproteobacteria bacterium]|nr:adenylate/guanylate cyclase domain-containing protein [Gammaproteobacteria bacterium]
MELTNRNCKKLYVWAVFVLVSGIIGVVYSLSVGGQPKIAFTIGCVIGGGVVGFELFWIQQPIGAWLRGLPLLAFLTISTLVWTVIIAASLQIIPRFFGLEQIYGADYHATTFRQDIVVSLIVAFTINAVLRIRGLVGGRVLTNFLIGRYHRPLREQRVFLFLDLADSTHLSEKLGDVHVQSLIGQFFFDIAQPIAEHGGETHRYIGDEIVVTWPYSDAIKDARCLECVFDIQKLIVTNSPRYQADFGVTPQFRVGMHGGYVVASEVGDEKREIVYFGDTINTAARLQSLCKEKKTDFLISGEILEAITLPPNAKAQYMGDIELRGKSNLLKVYALAHGVNLNAQ